MNDHHVDEERNEEVGPRWMICEQTLLSGS